MGIAQPAADRGFWPLAKGDLAYFSIRLKAGKACLVTGNDSSDRGVDNYVDPTQAEATHRPITLTISGGHWPLYRGAFDGRFDLSLSAVIFLVSMGEIVGWDHCACRSVKAVLADKSLPCRLG